MINVGDKVRIVDDNITRMYLPYFNYDSFYTVIVADNNVNTYLIGNDENRRIWVCGSKLMKEYVMSPYQKWERSIQCLS